MKIESHVSPLDGRYTVTATMDADLVRVGPDVLRDAMAKIAERIADDYIANHGSAVLAAIPVQSMVNRVISKTVEKFGRFLDSDDGPRKM